MLAERARVIQEELEDESETVASSSCSFGSKALELMVTRESRRLEKSIRDQLKRKSHAEHEIEKRAEKTKWLQEKLQSRKLRVAQTEQLREAKSMELHAVHEARFSVRDQVRDQNREEFEARVSRLKAKQIEESEKLEEFKREKLDQHSASAEVYEAKQREIRERALELNRVKKLKHLSMESERMQKLTEVENRRSRRLRLEQLRGEESTLRVIDALAKKKQRERVDALKREEIGALLSEELEQASLLELGRDQVSKQRKFVASEQRKQVIIPETAHVLPGPCEYEINVSSMTETPVAKISTVKPKLSIPGTIDFETARAAQVPGPGMYDYTVGGDSVSLSWSGARKTTFVEDNLKAKLDLPGPTSYTVKSDLLSDHGPKIVRDTFQRLDRGKHWVEADATPGPATYTVDAFTRKEKLLKAFQKFDPPSFAPLPPIVEPLHEITDVYEI